MRNLILMVLMVWAVVACGGELPASAPVVVVSGSSGEPVPVPEAVPPREPRPQIRGTVGVSLGILFVSINTRGELEIGVEVRSPDLPTPLGKLQVFAQGSVEFPQKQTLTIATEETTWIYDLQGNEFRVELTDVDAIVTGDGNGNIVIMITDSRVQKETDPHFYAADANDQITMNPQADMPVTQMEIGRSANGEPLVIMQLGHGPRAIVLIGGLHAGFAPGSVSLAQEMVEHFSANGDQIPSNVSLYIMPLANPDSLSGGVETKAGRLNGNGVDPNRNWDCNWSASAQWRTIPLDPGSGPFSEPETQALRDFFLVLRPKAVIFYGARGELVVPGDRTCGQRNSQSGSQNLASIYGARSGYKYGFITSYPISGDATDWLDRQGIPAISILLSDYTATDWDRNLRGIQDVLAETAR